MHDFRHLLRRLVRTPGFTLITLLTLAIGIGANTAIFAVLNGVLLKPLPFADPDGLIGVWQSAPGLNIPELGAAPSTYLTYREEGRTFEDIVFWRTGSANLTGTSEPERVSSLYVSDAFLPLLRVRPQIGRGFTKLDDQFGQPETVMLTNGYWRTKFGANPAVIGQRLMIDGKAREVIGVMPEEFRFMDFTGGLIMPVQLDRSRVFVGNFGFQAFARLKPGVTMAQASADVARMIPMMERKFPMPPGISHEMLVNARITPNLRPLKNDLVGDIGGTLWILSATIAMVLFIACANVANLLLVRAEGRQNELAVRKALGASRWQIARDLLLESGTLGVAGGVVGLGFAYGALRLLKYLSPPFLPRLEEITLDPIVVAFSLVLSLACGLLFGLIPVWKHAGSEEGLKGGGRTMSDGRERHRARNTLVIVQVGLAMVLLVSAGLMIRTMYALSRVDPGFVNPAEVTTLRLTVLDSPTRNAAQVARLHQSMAEKVAAIPGVTAVGITNNIPMTGGNNFDPLYAEGLSYQEGKLPPMRRHRYVAPGYFHSMGVRLLAGRDFTWEETHALRPVAMVSEGLAKAFWGSPAAALGRRVRENPAGVWREVIGVTASERDDGVSAPAPNTVYWPIMMGPFWNDKVQVQSAVGMVIRSPRTGTTAFMNEVRQAIWSLDPSVPIASVRTLEEVYSRSLARTSFALVLLSISAALALCLGVIGIYGVISYSVSQRSREIGIRLALGSPRGAVQGLFLRYGLTMSSIGVACGLVVALLLSRGLSAMLFEVSPVDPVTYTAVGATLLAAALLAAYLPARRAAAIDPMTTLRSE
jgi:putative ABC transport system permease protein